MFSLRTRIATAPEQSAKLKSLNIKKGATIFDVISESMKDSAFFERKGSTRASEGRTRDSKQDSTIDEKKDDKSNPPTIEVEEGLEKFADYDGCELNDCKSSETKPIEREEGYEENKLTESQVIQSRVDSLCCLRDSVALSVMQRVAKYASDGRNNANAAVVAWRNANTKQLQAKAKTRCARICRELWEQLEKQKKQVISIRNENTHYMHNLTRDESKKNSQPHEIIMEEEEFEPKDSTDAQELNCLMETFSTSETHETFGGEEETRQEIPARMLDCNKVIGDETCKEETKKNEATHDHGEKGHFIEVKSPHGSPLTIETETVSSDGEDSIGSTDVMTANEVNALSMSDDICAVQRSTIDFALAIIDCDVVLLDIDAMQSLILVAEKAINGKVFKPPIPKPVIRRNISTNKLLSSQLATVKAKVSVRASRKMNAIQRAIAKVDKHRQKQRQNITR